MKKILMLGIAFVISSAMLLTACKKDEVNNNGNNSGNTENPGGDGSVTPNQEYPSTAVVLPQAVADIDGNTYDAVQIGEQIWMAENLRTTRYADGTTIPMGTSTSSTTAYRYAPGPNYSNDENMDYVAHSGYLYNWPAVMHGESSSETNPSGVQGICPNGWHVPSDLEWNRLTTYLSNHSDYLCSGSSYNIAKALASTSGWQLSDEHECAVGNDPSTNNASGFSAPPAGDYNGNYLDFGFRAYFWSATSNSDYVASGCYINYKYASVTRISSIRCNGFSVRCLHD